MHQRSPVEPTSVASDSAAANGMPRYLQMNQFHISSVPCKVDPAVLAKVTKYNGEPTGISLKGWLEEVAAAMLLIPKANENPGLLPYILLTTVDGRAKECLRVVNERARAE